jgi:ribonuclease R
MVFDARGKIERIVPVRRNDAHRLIEECMLAANVCASGFLSKHDHPMLYRVHEGPTPEKLAALREFLKGFGLALTGGDKPHAGDYAKLLEKTKARPDALLLQTVMLRSLQQAVYSPDNAGHFGLAYESYTHFTSPIRRYPDLLVHRAIKAALQRRRYDPGNWRELGLHCSTTERRADEATRDVAAWLKCYYMKDRIGEVFEGQRERRRLVRRIRGARRGLCRGAGTRVRARQRLLPLRRCQAPALGRAHAQALPAGRPHAGQAGAGGPGYGQNRFHIGVAARYAL